MATILHLSKVKNAIFLWGEVSADIDDFPSHLTIKKIQSQPQPYPFNADLKRIKQVLKQIPIGIKPKAKKKEQVLAWLPTKGKYPVPSSPIIAEIPGSRAKVKLTAWKLTALHLNTNQAMDLLSVCKGRQTLAPGVIPGPDIFWWTSILNFSASLVTRQKYLPSIILKKDDAYGRWEPLYIAEDQKILTKLSQSMPSVARAISVGNEDSPPDTAPIAMIKDSIGDFVDFLLRTPVADIESQPKKNKPRRSFDSVHDAWFNALRTEDAQIDADENEIYELRSKLAEWRRPVRVMSTAKFRLCFRLEEPQKLETAGANVKIATENWFVRYLLQPYDEPSLFFEANDIYKVKGKRVELIKKHGTNAKEIFLSSLGQACGICPGIAGSLEQAEPDGYCMETSEAYEFLTQKAMTLEDSGFCVILPAWWSRKGTKTKVTAKAKVKSPKMIGKSGLSLGSLVQFDWELALGGQKLGIRELQSLAKFKAPLVQIRGQWVELNAEEIKNAIDFWKQKGSSETSLMDIVKMSIGAGESTGGVDVETIEAKGLIADLLENLNSRTDLEELPQPQSLLGTLRPYQLRGFSWLSFLRYYGLGACLADDMGLGKTVQTLALIERDRVEGNKQPVLLICPTSVTGNWKKESEKFTPKLPVMVHHGIQRKKDKKFVKEAQKHSLVISSYGLLQRDFNFLKDVPWAGVILDEAQNIKNPETKQSKSARSIKADYRIALTGTPVENNVGDLWSIMEFLNPTFLGSQAAFKRDFFYPIQTRQDRDASEKLKKITAPFILRRLKTDKSIISDLPEKMEMITYCNLTKEQASLYAAVLKDTEDALTDSEGIKRKGVILATMSKLKQVCNHPAQFLGDNSRIDNRSGKLNRLTEMLEVILESNERALIFSQFSEMGNILKRHLQDKFGREVLFLHGGVPKKKRDLMIERFQSNGNSMTPFFILSLKAGGTGLNLTNANHVFHFDRWWNPAVENQATDRAFRIGQAKDVHVYKFVCAGTMEDSINEMIERKKAIAENVVGTGEGWLTELSNKELKNIFKLRKDAIGE